MQTKNSSKTNKARNKASSDSITVNFFAKFVKSKVDKKRSIEDIRGLVAALDLDGDGVVSVSDLEALVGRANFHQYFEKVQAGTIKQQGSKPTEAQLQTIHKLEINLKKLASEKSEQLYPAATPNNPEEVEYLSQIVKKVRDVMNTKRLRFPEVFAVLDPQHAGLVSF